jgi:hypothetical protein
MFECLILGDSTGVGAAKAINALYARQCDVQAVEGARAAQILSWRRSGKDYGTCIFSLGSNDHAGPALAARLSAIRTKACFRRVIWLLPYARPQAYTVSSVAARFGDETVDLGRFASVDGIHPRRYRDVAAALLKKGR